MFVYVRVHVLVRMCVRVERHACVCLSVSVRTCLPQLLANLKEEQVLSQSEISALRLLLLCVMNESELSVALIVSCARQNPRQSPLLRCDYTGRSVTCSSVHFKVQRKFSFPDSAHGLPEPLRPCTEAPLSFSREQMELFLTQPLFAYISRAHE